ncbi:MAG: UDP-N-acetyl-D-glucosamine 2-epimerase, UDP-hydrolyzing [Patescibacteria group bacterium]|nr:UDP-N-acetyl-D-glucosamine 2-epimerase, UDP-hydrolyzing [Patescibacteria group bacterium]
MFVTERRTDYSRLKSIMEAVQKSEKLELQLLVTGIHLLKDFGETKKFIDRDGFKIDAILPMFSDEDIDDGSSMVKGLGRVLSGMPDIFKKLKPDILFAGFDIGANFAAAITAMHLNIHVSHHEGGERSGTIDEVMRHAITKFSHVHFACSDQSVRRIIRLGEDPRYVFNVGVPSIQTIKEIKYWDKDKIFEKYDLDSGKKLIIFLQHSVTTEVDSVEAQIRESAKAINEIIDKHKVQAIAIYPNNDAGGRRIVEFLNQSGIKVFPHIDRDDFFRLMKVADALVGNSSSGIHETPTFGLPTVNVGTRQQFRERGGNVIDAGYDSREIKKAIEKALSDKNFLRKSRKAKNPYDQGNSAEKIVHILETIDLPPIQKVITY